MSMIELGFFLFCAALAVIGWVVGSHFWNEWYYRALAAVVGGFLPIALFKVILQASAVRLKKRAPYPLCENGSCGWDDYHAVRSEGTDIEFICKCGKRYLKSGQRFFKLLDDGRRLPYKVLKRGHQWEDDI